FKGRAQKLREEVMVVTSNFWRELAYRAKTRRHILSQKDPLRSEELENKLQEVFHFYKEYAAALVPKEEMLAPNPIRAAEREKYLKLAAKVDEKAALLGEFRVLPNEHTTYFIEGMGDEEKNRHVKLKSKAIEVGGLMRTALFERYPTVVQTSATLAV